VSPSQGACGRRIARVSNRASLNRVFPRLGRFDVSDAEGFLHAVRGIDWPAHLRRVQHSRAISAVAIL